MASRYELSELPWERIKDGLPGRAEHVGRTAVDNRQFVNGVLWVLRRRKTNNKNKSNSYGQRGWFFPFGALRVKLTGKTDNGRSSRFRGCGLIEDERDVAGYSVRRACIGSTEAARRAGRAAARATIVAARMAAAVRVSGS